MTRNAEQDLRVCEAATRGPWEFRFFIDGKACYIQRKTDGSINLHIADTSLEKDALFIITAREALPYWIDRAQELEKERDQVASRNADLAVSLTYSNRRMDRLISIVENLDKKLLITRGGYDLALKERDAAREEVVRLEAENRRLREALERIVTRVTDDDTSIYGALIECVEIAEKALEGGGN